MCVCACWDLCHYFYLVKPSGKHVLKHVASVGMLQIVSVRNPDCTLHSD